MKLKQMNCLNLGFWIFDRLDVGERKWMAIKDIVSSMELSFDNCPLTVDCLIFKIFSEFILSKNLDEKIMSKSTCK